MKRIALLFLAIALLYVGAGFLPGRTFAPVDLLRDFEAWKDDPTERVRVSNSALSDVVVQFIAWDVETRRLLRAVCSVVNRPLRQLVYIIHLIA